MTDLEKGKAPEHHGGYETSVGDLPIPTLEQVLHRKTLPPVCLYNFYIVMRDRLHSEEYLDFYLDVSSHETLWKRYLGDLKRSGTITNQDLIDAGRDDVAGRALLSRLSYNSISKNSSVRSHIRPFTPDDEERDLLGSPGPAGRPDSPSTERSATPGPEAIAPYDPKKDDVSRRDNPRRDPTADTIRNSVVAISGRPVSREDVTASAERIFFRYIVPAADKELHGVPKPILDRVMYMRETEGRIDPGVFAEAKKSVFTIMKTEYFPKFLLYKAWRNITLMQSMLRLVLGLFCLFIGFAVELSIIFLGYESKVIRVWGLIPLFFGILNLLVSLIQLDPIWVLIFGVSETTTFRFNRIREPVVRRILYRRAAWLLSVIIIIAAIVTVVFAFIPSGVLYAP